MGQYLTLAQAYQQCGKSGISAPPPTDTDPAPTFLEHRERFLVDYYCSRPRAERLAMYQRGRVLRCVHPGWPREACDLQAMDEHFAEHPAEPPFVMARDGMAFAQTEQ